MRNFLLYLQRKYHPLAYARRSRFFSYLIRYLDFNCWASDPRLNFKYNVKFFRDINRFLGTYNREEKSLSLLRKIAETSQISSFCDIGANVGFYSWFIKSINSATDIAMFEPNDTLWKNLENTINKNRLESVVVFKIALSNTSGAVTFKKDVFDSETGTIISDIVTADEKLYNKKVREVTIPARTLDGLLAEGKLRPPDVAKIDVEGAEDIVIEGAIETIRQYKPLIIAEIRNDKLNRIYQLLGGLYDFFVIESISGSDIENYLLIPMDKHDIVARFESSLVKLCSPAV